MTEFEYLAVHGLGRAVRVVNDQRQNRHHESYGLQDSVELWIVIMSLANVSYKVYEPQSD
jgi:hypothetical protein